MPQDNRLERAPWRTAPQTLAVVDALEVVRAGASRFVGGCVRNTLMGRPVDDIDMATQLRPDEVMAALEAAGLKSIPTGIEHGTVTAISAGIPYEITTLRRDVSTDGRRAVVAFTEDWAEDAARRDFRLNALYASPDGVLYDPTDGGYEDARAGRVIFIGDADQRLQEDYLRILRFFRFNAWYGAGIDALGLDACARHGGGLKQIAAERIWKELKKTLAADNPLTTLQAMGQSGVLEVVLGHEADLARVQRLRRLEEQFADRADPMRRFMSLVPPAPDMPQAAEARFRLSGAETSRLSALAKLVAIPPPLSSKADIRAALYRFGPEALMDYVLVGVGDTDIERVRELAGNWPVPSLPIKGEDIVVGGVAPGPQIGRILRVLEQRWIESDFSLSRPELLDLIMSVQSDLSG